MANINSCIVRKDVDLDLLDKITPVIHLFSEHILPCFSVHMQTVNPVQERKWSGP